MRGEIVGLGLGSVGEAHYRVVDVHCVLLHALVENGERIEVQRPFQVRLNTKGAARLRLYGSRPLCRARALSRCRSWGSGSACRAGCGRLRRLLRAVAARTREKERRGKLAAAEPDATEQLAPRHRRAERSLPIRALGIHGPLLSLRKSRRRMPAGAAGPQYSACRSFAAPSAGTRVVSWDASRRPTKCQSLKSEILT